MREQALYYLRQATNNPQAHFRPGQWESIEALVVRRSRALVVQRTGWGKSLVYFLSTKLHRDAGLGATLLISPLIALMRDQELAAQRVGLRVARLDSSNTSEWPQIKQNVLSGDFDILLVSPERLGNANFKTEILEPISSGLSLIVVDEAHCISDWGHDFRPDYRRIARLVGGLPSNFPVLATTATANNSVLQL